MKNTATLFGLGLAVLLAAGCASTPQTADVSPGAVEDVQGATFSCSKTSCRVVADAQANQDAVAYTVTRSSSCSAAKAIQADATKQCPYAAQKRAQLAKSEGDGTTVSPGAVGGTRKCCGQCPAGGKTPK